VLKSEQDILSPQKTLQSLGLSNDFYLAELKKAVSFLKDTCRIKTDSQIVRKTGFSKSYISQMMSGRKPLTHAFIKKFEKAYNVCLGDSKTYSFQYELKERFEKANDTSPAMESFLKLSKYIDRIYGKEVHELKERKKQSTISAANYKKLIVAHQEYKKVIPPAVLEVFEPLEDIFSENDRQFKELNKRADMMFEDITKLLSLYPEQKEKVLNAARIIDDKEKVIYDQEKVIHDMEKAIHDREKIIKALERQLKELANNSMND
jgi:transcriptional regulator with XRE-family HTH domain